MSKRVLPLLVFLLFSSFRLVFAQEGGILPGESLMQPKEREVQVTASVRDDDPPSTPILIAPENNSTITTNKPTFVWKESIDAFSTDVQYYTLYLDGIVKFDTIPITNTENGDYVLTYDSSTGYLSLTPKGALSEGTHTWKIIATDFYDNIASSVTWTFTIDTQAPTFIITDIGDIEVTISAQDTSTVPEEAIVLTDNEPLLQGTGEANSEVVLTVTFQDGSTETYEFTINQDGEWEVQLGILPRDQVIYLDFTITDTAGHISVLNDVPMILYSPEIVIEIPFVPPTVIPPIVIVITPPKEIIPVIIEELPPEVKKPVQQFAAAFPFYYPTPQKPSLPFWTNFLVLIIISALPLLKTIMLAFDFGKHFSPAHLYEIWQVIGFLPWGKKQGIVIEQKSQIAVQYAQVIFSVKHDEYTTSTIIKLTNKQGIYLHAGLEKNEYRVSIKHPQYVFPTTEPNPHHLFWNYFYSGQEFSIHKDGYEPALVIPVQKSNTPVSLWQKLKLWLLNRSMSTFKMWTLAIAVTAVFPTFWNIAATILYTLILLYMHLRRKKVTVYGTFITKEKTPIFNSVLFLLGADITQVKDISQTNKDGLYVLHGDKESSAVTVTDFMYQVAEKTKEAARIEITDKLIHNKAHLPLIGVPVALLCDLTKRQTIS